jgi:two-component SAPR family response regulator
MKQIGLIKKLENLMRDMTIIFLTSCHTFMANSPRVAIGDNVVHPGLRSSRRFHAKGCKANNYNT